MTFLPIVERELRVAARRRGTYFVRSAVALAAILTCAVIIFLNGGTPTKLGQYTFLGLSIISMIYCVFSGRISTADCLSEEKREGTLGLLFLTDLKGYDVILGKLVATSVNALYALLAVMPVLAISMLLGGVSNGEFWRVVLVLVDTFLLSLAIGIFGSAISRNARQAMGNNLGLLLLFMVLIPLGAAALSNKASAMTSSSAFISCPYYSFQLCEDARYLAAPKLFWLSVGVTHLSTWLLLALASWILPRTWQDKPAVKRLSQSRSTKEKLLGFWRALSFGSEAKLASYRKQLLDSGNAFYWRAARARLKPIHVWIFIVLAAIWWVWVWRDSTMRWYDDTISLFLALLLNTTIKSWIAIESAQALAEDQKAGALELLLSTPLTIRDIVRGQLMALRRQFLKPLKIIIAIELIFMTGKLLHTGSQADVLTLWLAGIFMLIADVFTLPFVSLSMALTAKSPNHASLSSIVRVLIVPSAVFWLAALIVRVCGFSAENYQETYLLLWLGFGLAANLFFGLRAWRRLTYEFRELATQRFAPAASRAYSKPANSANPPVSSRWHRRWPARKKALVFAAAALLIACAVLAFGSKPKFPPPLVVSITQSNGPVRVFPGLCVRIMLPDGSLWRWGLIHKSQIERIPVPELANTNHDWLQVSSSISACIGIRKDGTLWQSRPGSSSMEEFQQVDSAHDWASVSADFASFMALKQDGTLWAWGDNSSCQLGNGPGKSKGSLAQVGTNSDWMAAKFHGMGGMGVRSNGTLWIWGRTYPVAALFPTPTQFSQETNWSSLEMGFGNWVRNASGEVWQPILSSANSNATVLSTCNFIASNSVPGRLITAIGKVPRMYELRDDGTLWQKPFTLGWPGSPKVSTVELNEKWQKVGKRADWVAIWGGTTAIGLTRDGTIWTWGFDPSREGTPDLSFRLQLIAANMKGLLGTTTTIRRTTMQREAFPAIQEEPRPLMRVIISR